MQRYQLWLKINFQMNAVVFKWNWVLWDFYDTREEAEKAAKIRQANQGVRVVLDHQIVLVTTVLK